MSECICTNPCSARSELSLRLGDGGGGDGDGGGGGVGDNAIIPSEGCL